MALRYIDSMGDHYAVGDVAKKWTSGNGFRAAGVHGFCMSGSFQKGMNFPGNTIIMECYIYRINIPDQVFSLRDTNNNTEIHCNYNANGSVEVYRWAGPLLFQSAPDLIRTGTWYHLGWKVFVHPSNGSVEVRLNGETICNLTGIPTVMQLYVDNPDPYYWSGMVGAFTIGGSGNGTRLDDLVVMDDVADGINDPRLPGGGGFTKFIGPVEVRVKRPAGPGLVADWTPTPVVPNWQNVDDVDPDADTTYNLAAASAVGASDLFAMEDLLPGEDVLAVQSLVLARKTDEGTAALAKLSNDGTTTRAGTTVYQPSTYSYMHAPEPLAPDGTLWTAAKWNAMQYGYRRII